MERLSSLRGADVISADQEKIGSVEEIFVDEETGQPEWIGLGTGMFRSKRVLVPVQGAEFGEDAVIVPYSKDQVKDTPDIDGDHVSQEAEQGLYAHYGLDYSERRSGSGLPEGEASGATGTVDETEVVRSEEELQVGKRESEAGRVRLHKWVETEPVEMNVDLKQETARVTRETIDQPVSDAEIAEDDVEVALHREEAVVQKQAVAKERVGLEKDVETERETVRDELRKERVEVEGENVER
jgi:uncharacterized protein (TIGR02271 family)